MFQFNKDFRRFYSCINQNQAIIEFDLDGFILSANNIFLDIMGYDIRGIIGRHHSIFVDSAHSQSEVYINLWKSLKSGQFFSGEFCRIDKAGNEVWISGSYMPVMKGDKPIKIVKIATVITEIKSASAKAESLIKAMDRSQAMIEFDLDGIVVNANQNFLAALGYSIDEIRGQHHRMFVDPAEAESDAYSEFWKKLRAGEFFVAEYKRLSKGGQVVWIQASYNPFFNSHGKPVGVVKFATDITAEMVQRLLRTERQATTISGISAITDAISNTSEQATSAAAAAAQATNNLSAVTAGSSQMAASVAEISDQVRKALVISNEAVAQTANASRAVMDLVENAKKISAVVDLISSIAGQTNLLALNATIEAARAGEAGRGFSVVASEVKQLAAQTATAIGSIGAHIRTVQNSSEMVHGAIDSMSGIITNINDASMIISAALEQQSAVAIDMSNNMHQATSGVSLISQAAEEVAQLMRKAHENTKLIVDAANAAA